MVGKLERTVELKSGGTYIGLGDGEVCVAAGGWMALPREDLAPSRA